MSRIESLIDLVEEIKRDWTALLDRENQRQGNHGLLAAGKLPHFQSFCCLAGERDLDQNPWECFKENY